MKRDFFTIKVFSQYETKSQMTITLKECQARIFKQGTEARKKKENLKTRKPSDSTHTHTHTHTDSTHTHTHTHIHCCICFSFSMLI